MELAQTAPRRAWEETKGVFHNPFFWGIEIVGGAIVTAAVLNFAPFGLSGFVLSLYQALAPVSYIIAIFSLVLLARLARAPYVQRDEARALLAGRAEVDVITSYPVVHAEKGVAPYGDYILIPGLNITNHAARTLDCELGLDVTLYEGDYRRFLLGLENSEIVNAPSSLPRGLRGNEQYREPIRVAGESREIGFAAFSVDILPPDSIDSDWSNVEQLVLTITDGVTNVQIVEHEVWPSIWPEVFERAKREANN